MRSAGGDANKRRAVCRMRLVRLQHDTIIKQAIARLPAVYRLFLRIVDSVPAFPHRRLYHRSRLDICNTSASPFSQVLYGGQTLSRYHTPLPSGR